MALNGWGRAIDRLEGLNANIRCKDGLGRTPLHYAALSDRGDAVESLQRIGADLGAVDNLGRTPLFFAMLNESPGPARALLRDRKQREKQMVAASEGWTPLHVAAALGRDANVVLVLQKLESSPQFASMLNAQTASGKTALHLAARAGSAASIRALLEWNANSEILDKSGHRPADHDSPPQFWSPSQPAQSQPAQKDPPFARALAAASVPAERVAQFDPNAIALEATLWLDGPFCRASSIERSSAQIAIGKDKGFVCRLEYPDGRNDVAKIIAIDDGIGLMTELAELRCVESARHSFSAPHIDPSAIRIRWNDREDVAKWATGLARGLGEHYLDSLLMESRFELTSLVLRDHGIPVHWYRGQ
jgi:hypothetical protein